MARDRAWPTLFAIGSRFKEAAMIRYIVFASAVVGVGLAIAVAWGWGPVVTYASFVGLATCFGIAIAAFNVSGGRLARFGGRLTYRRWLG
jgi:hypothetical protein